MSKGSKKLKVSIFEIVWYSLTGAVGLWGLTYIVLGLIASYAKVARSQNVLADASADIKAAFGLGFLGWGLIILAIAVVAAVFCLCITANGAARDADKAARRAARLGLEEEAVVETIEANPVAKEDTTNEPAPEVETK